jgi:hypothetical protein
MKTSVMLCVFVRRFNYFAHAGAVAVDASPHSFKRHLHHLLGTPHAQGHSV